VTAGGFLRRTLAFPIDAILVGATWLSGAIWLVIAEVLAARDPGALPRMALLAGAVLALGVVLSAVYFVGFVGACGQTPAKMLVGVRVVRRDGAPVGFGRATVRWLGYGLVALTLGLGWLVAALNADRRGLPDWLAGTRVIRDET
jgi:uncharacterized RDD family membrane protein YckC